MEACSPRIHVRIAAFRKGNLNVTRTEKCGAHPMSCNGDGELDIYQRQEVKAKGRWSNHGITLVMDRNHPKSNHGITPPIDINHLHNYL